MLYSVKPWQQLDDRLLQKTRVFDLHAKRMRSPDASYEGDFYYLRTADWVNVIALTEQEELVLIEQFRHGISQPTLECPGGMLDPGEEDHLAAAKRELEEETGYSAPQIVPIGMVHPNPALLNNRCFFYAAEHAQLSKAQHLDDSEDIAVRLVPLHEVPKLIATGKITHAMVINAFYFFSEYRRSR